MKDSFPAVVAGLTAETISGQGAFRVSKFEPPRGVLPALKVPDPQFLVRRLRQGESAALLSRRQRTERVGDPQALVNELSQSNPKSVFVWAVVAQDAPIAMASMVELSKEQRAGIDPLTAEEFSTEKNIWYLPLQLVVVFDPPLKLRQAPEGRRFGGEVDFDQDVVKAVAFDVMQFVAAPDPERLRSLSDEDLRTAQKDLILWFTEYFAGNSANSGGGASREDVVNAYIFVMEEGRRRGLELTSDPGLDGAAAVLKSVIGSKFAVIHPSGLGKHHDDPATLDEVLAHWSQPMALRMPAVFLVGSLCNHRKSDNDIDVLIRGPLDEETRHVIKFRLGRALPPRLSSRVQFHDDSQGGPFTTHVPLYDLVLVPHARKVQIEMVAKQDDPLLDWPKKLGERSGVLQAHFRGSGYHLDLRMQVADYLVGWTIAAMKPGITGKVDTIEEANRVMAPFDMEGSAANKAMILPSRVYAVPKSRQPLEWLTIGDVVFEPGSVGATRFEAGVYVELAKLKVEWGKQDPHFHEYFVFGTPEFEGTLTFRMLEGGVSRSTEDLTGTGEMFWTSGFAKVALPSILRSRSVETGAMPPLGQSAMPSSLMAITPREFRFWEADGEAEARKIRDALVSSKFFTEENVRFVDGDYTRISTKVRSDAIDVEQLDKQVRVSDFVLSWQYWKGQTVVRGTPSRQIFHLMLPVPAGGRVQDFQLQIDPLSGEESILAALVEGSDELLTFEGDASPGLEVGGIRLNNTKATPSTMKIIDQGKVDVLDDQPTFKKLRFRGSKLKGLFTLVLEEVGSDFWIFSPGSVPSRNVPSIEKSVRVREDGMQMWDIASRSETDDRGGDREKLRPPALFQPMKPAPRPSNRFTDPETAAREAFTDALLADGVRVEPKYNGFRAIAERWEAGLDDGALDDGVMIYTEDAQRDLAKILPGLTKDLEGLGGSFILDGEIMALVPGTTDEFLPRADLAQFRGTAPADDEQLRFVVFDMLYHPTLGNLLAQPLAKREASLGAWLLEHKDSAPHILKAPGLLAVSREELLQRMKVMSAKPGSEGAMLKQIGSTYSLGGEQDLWVKVKVVREILAMVVERHEVKGSPGVYNFVGAIGPIPEGELAQWAEPVELNGKHWAMVGRTGNRKLDANVGDVIATATTEIFFEEGPPIRIRWFGPAQALAKVDMPPTTISELKALLRPGEISSGSKEDAEGVMKAGRAVRIVKATQPTKDTSERYVFGVVLIPDETDAQGDVYTAADVRKAAHSFLEFFGGKFRVMHQGEPIEGIQVLESYLSKQPETHGEETFPTGTWFLASRVRDDKIWAAIQAGEFTGFSMGGTALREKLSSCNNREI